MLRWDSQIKRQCALVLSVLSLFFLDYSFAKEYNKPRNRFSSSLYLFLILFPKKIIAASVGHPLSMRLAKLPFSTIGPPAQRCFGLTELQNILDIENSDKVFGGKT